MGRKMPSETTPGRRPNQKARPLLEALEDRLTPASVWTNPSLITYSFVADGVASYKGTSVLNQVLNSKFAETVWRREVALALQSWAPYAPINFAQTPDTKLAFIVPGGYQGSPLAGDIRIAGYSFPISEARQIGNAFSPNPGLDSIAGDIQLNTSYNWSIGSSPDLYSLMLHEVGHSLGLLDVSDPQRVMNHTYMGLRTGVTDLDAADLRALYGPRQPDAYNAAGLGVSQAVPIRPTSDLVANTATTISRLDLTRISETDWFALTVPAGAASTLDLTVKVAGMSLLNPSARVLDATGKVIASGGSLANYGKDLKLSMGVNPGQTYTVAVTGASADVFSVGRYDLELLVRDGLPTSPPTPPPPPPTPPPPPPPPPPTPVTPPNPGGGPGLTNPAPVVVAQDFKEPNNNSSQAVELGRLGTITLANLTLDQPTDQDFFTFRAYASANYSITAKGTTILVRDARSKVLAHAVDRVTFKAPRAATKLSIQIGSPSQRAVSSYSLRVAQVFVPLPRNVRPLSQLAPASDALTSQSQSPLRQLAAMSTHPAGALALWNPRRSVQ